MVPTRFPVYTAYAFDELGPIPEDGTQMFPDGNSGIARLIAKTLIPESIAGLHVAGRHLSSASEFCRTRSRWSRGPHSLGFDRGMGEARWRSREIRVRDRRLHARREDIQSESAFRGDGWRQLDDPATLCATFPEDRKEAYAQFYRSPCMVANVAVRNWRFLYKMGISGCQWFEGLGNYMQVRKLALCGADSPTIGPDSPVVLTIKVLYSYPGKTAERTGPHGTRGNDFNVRFATTSDRFVSSLPTCSRAPVSMRHATSPELS